MIVNSSQGGGSKDTWVIERSSHGQMQTQAQDHFGQLQSQS
jgi:uncharacterized circularly permuted ATP-grasp superfamily protein